MNSAKVFNQLHAHLDNLVRINELPEDPIVVTAKPLTPDEAIGNPEHDDYPLLKGRERMMEAAVRGACGQAFTDMYGRWEGRLKDVLDLPLTNDFRRAVFVATLNAGMRYARELDGTLHCRDDGPVECGKELRTFVCQGGLEPPFVLIGYQPRFAETLASLGELRIVDMDIQHIGQERYGVIVHPPEETDQALDACKSAFVTGTTLVNATIAQFLNLPVPTIFYGVTIAGAATILGLRRFCAQPR